MIPIIENKEQSDNWGRFLKETEKVNGGLRNVVSPEKRQKVVHLYKEYEGRQKPIVRELHMGAATVSRILREEGITA